MTKFLIIPVLFFCVHLHAQSWTYITPPRGNFSFSLPAAATAVDTLGLLSYNFVLPTDSTICFQVQFMANAAISGNTDLQAMLDSSTTMNASFSSNSTSAPDTIGEALNVYAQLYQQFTGGTIQGFTDTTYNSNIRGENLAILYSDLNGGSTQYFAFTRYYYYNSQFIAFTLTGPQSEMSVLNGYKNQFFASIGLNW